MSPDQIASMIVTLAGSVLILTGLGAWIVAAQREAHGRLVRFLTVATRPMRPEELAKLAELAEVDALPVREVA